MEIKVKAVESPDSKSVQEVEKELLEKHEESLNDEAGEANMEGVEQSTESATTTEEQESVQPEGEAQTELLSNANDLAKLSQNLLSGKELSEFVKKQYASL